MSADAHLDPYARALYAQGKTGIDVATALAEIEIDVALKILAARAVNPAAHPGYGPTPTADSIAAKVVAAFLDAGWAPPDGTEAAS